MKRNRFYIVLLLTAALLMGAFWGSVGQAHARVSSVAGWQMQLMQPKEEDVQLVSRVMDDQGTVVRLQDLYADDVRRVLIDMEVLGGTANGTLYCTPSSELLYATCLETIDDASEQEFTILLTPSEEAELITEPVDVSVYVEWNSHFNTTLQVRLLPVPDEEYEQPAAAAQWEEEEEWVPLESFMTGMADFDPQGLLALELTVPEGCDRIRLSRDYASFPAFTRYKIGDDKRYTLLYDGGNIEIKTRNLDKIQLLMDFRDVNLGGQPLAIAAEAMDGDRILGTDYLVAEPTARLPEAVIEDNPIILTAERTWSMELSEGLADTNVLYHMRRSDGSEDNLAVLYRDGNTLIISATDGDFRAPAGTYILDITWEYREMTVATRTITFYINYSAYVQPGSDAAAEPSGGNEL